MYPPMQLDAVGDKPGVDYYLKPMNCPMHNLIFSSRGRSYRELPAAAVRVRLGLPL